jgi:hypothetical protein
MQKAQASRARLIFAIDATASRAPTWKLARQLQAEMFLETAKIGGLEVQLVYYRGLNGFHYSHWTSNGRELANNMTEVTCDSGPTQIGRLLAHVRQECAGQKVGAVTFIGDAAEESPQGLYDAATGLGVPLFLFQEGDDPRVSEVFEELKRLTNGAHRRFSPGAARELADLLRAAAVFAVGGLAALRDLRSDGARKLLEQIKNESAA